MKDISDLGHSSASTDTWTSIFAGHTPLPRCGILIKFPPATSPVVRGQSPPPSSDGRPRPISQRPADKGQHDSPELLWDRASRISLACRRAIAALDRMQTGVWAVWVQKHGWQGGSSDDSRESKGCDASQLAGEYNQNEEPAARVSIWTD